MNESRFSESSYRQLSDEIYTYAEKYLTTRSVAAYMLERAGLADARRVLFVHLQHYFEFNQVSLHHGLSDLGLDVTAYPRLESHYKKRGITSLAELEDLRNRHLHAHGNGYLWGFRIHDPRQRSNQSGDSATIDEDLLASSYERMEVLDKIHAEQFDAVVYAGYNGGPVQSVPFFHHVVSKFSKDKVVFVTTLDHHGGINNIYDFLSDASMYGQLFLRELYDRYSSCSNPRPVDAALERAVCPSSLCEADLRIRPVDSEKSKAPQCSAEDDDKEHRVAISNRKIARRPESSVILLDGYHWGDTYVGPTLRSIRASGCTATIVLLVPHREAFASLLQNADTFLAYSPIRMVPFFNSSIEKNAFLFYAAAAFLASHEAFSYRKVIVSSSIETRWYRDAFELVGESAMVVRLPLHRFVDENYFLQCKNSFNGVDEWVQGRLRHRNSQTALPSRSRHATFSGHWISGSRDTVAHLLKSIKKTIGFHSCSNEASLTTFLHRFSPSYAEVVTAEWGPVVQHDGLTCSYPDTKVPRPLCGQSPDAAVLINRCEGTP